MTYIAIVSPGSKNSLSEYLLSRSRRIPESWSIAQRFVSQRGPVLLHLLHCFFAEYNNAKINLHSETLEKYTLRITRLPESRSMTQKCHFHERAQEPASRAPNLHLLFASKIFALRLGIAYAKERGREHRLHGCGNGKSESSWKRRRPILHVATASCRNGSRVAATWRGGINKNFTETNYRRFCRFTTVTAMEEEAT